MVLPAVPPRFSMAERGWPRAGRGRVSAGRRAPLSRREVVLNGAPHRHEASSRKPGGGVRAEQTRGTEAAATLGSFEPRASESEARSSRRAVRVPTRSACFLLCWAPALGGMLLSEEAPLNYFLPIVTFPALSSRSSRKVINHPGPATPPGAPSRPREETRPKPARGETLALPLPLPCSAKAKTKTHRSRADSRVITSARTDLAIKVPLLWGEARNPGGGGWGVRFTDFSLFPSPGARWTVGRDSERDFLSRPVRAAENWGRPVGWSVVEGVGGVT